MSGMPSGSNSTIDRNAQYMSAGGVERGNGGTTTGNDTSAMLADYENVFGPAARDIKTDSQQHKRHQRWHLPDALKGHNQYLTDRIDGLITDATSSPFTRNILPYVYLENPDQKLKWNVYSFDEGIASRVPYESAARVLPQSKRSFAGYAVRQGLAIAMEHNFMVSEAGRQNFKNQLNQLVGSIQLTNDLDVHMALLLAPSYQKTMNEKYHDNHKTLTQSCRAYIDMFGIMQKVPNAMDILIEDAKTTFGTWGSKPPTFCLCNNALTTQLNMNPERTDYVTNGPDGLKRLAAGPDLNTYRGMQIINSRKFSMDAGCAPRDLLRRKVRVAEYYHIPWKVGNEKNSYQFYDQSRDTMFRLTWFELLMASRMHEDGLQNMTTRPVRQFVVDEKIGELIQTYEHTTDPKEVYDKFDDLTELQLDILILRPNAEHYMLGVILGRGGTQELGATFWGQTELSCYDDAQHGIWGMSYKYHERAVVTNERNLTRVFDVAFDGYTGGLGQKKLVWDQQHCAEMKESMSDKIGPYRGVDMMVMSLKAGTNKSSWPNPIIFHESIAQGSGVVVCPESGLVVSNIEENCITHQNDYLTDTQVPANANDVPAESAGLDRFGCYWAMLGVHHWGEFDAGGQQGGQSAIDDRSNIPSMAFQGTMSTFNKDNVQMDEVRGSGHLGHSYVGCASVREGRGVIGAAGSSQTRFIRGGY